MWPNYLPGVTAFSLDNPVIRHRMTDPTMPELIRTIPVPELLADEPQFTVTGYTGGGYDLSTPEGQAANVFVTVLDSIRMVNNFNFEKKMTRWATTKNLFVIPRAGRKLNAAYDRRSLSFYYAETPEGTIYTADCPDIVAHELGHAILDYYRPDLWSTASLEIWAFHEAFGDMMAILSALQYDEVIEHLATVHQGNMMEPNMISNIAEQLGGTKGQTALRQLLNTFKYVEPSSLSKHGPVTDLLNEPHSFSRVLSGAIYEVFNMMYAVKLLEGVPCREAMKSARDTLGSYVFKAIRYAPNTPKMFEGFCKTLLWIDFNLPGRPYHDHMMEIFRRRELMSDKVTIQSHAGQGGMLHRTSNHEVIKLADRAGVRTLSNNPLLNVDLEISHNEYTFCEPDGAVIYELSTTKDEALDSAENLVTFLHDNGLVGKEMPFEVLEGRLTRSFFDCGCGGTGGLILTKHQPEFYKPYKPANNAGCCSGCRQTTSQTVEKKVKHGCAIRYQVPR